MFRVVQPSNNSANKTPEEERNFGPPQDETTPEDLESNIPEELIVEQDDETDHNIAMSSMKKTGMPIIALLLLLLCNVGFLRRK